MKCPVCNSVLTMTVRQGVEIDYCPLCRGVWLDRGELDKLLAGARRADDSRRDREDDDEPGPPFGAAQENARQNPKQRESFWSDLFDFG